MVKSMRFNRLVSRRAFIAGGAGAVALGVATGRFSGASTTSPKS